MKEKPEEYWDLNQATISDICKELAKLMVVVVLETKKVRCGIWKMGEEDEIYTYIHARTHEICFKAWFLDFGV